jgi:transposase
LDAVNCAGYAPAWAHAQAQALVAVEHSILVAIFYMLQRNQPYHDLGADYFIVCEDPGRRARKLIRQLEAIGYTIDAQPPSPAVA